MDALGYLKFIAALAFVLALIGLLAYLARRYGFGGMIMPARAKGRRLSICEILPIDPRRKLVLVRRDDIEHLLLLGASDLVIERVGPAAGDGSPSIEIKPDGNDADAVDHRGVN